MSVPEGRTMKAGAACLATLPRPTGVGKGWPWDSEGNCHQDDAEPQAGWPRITVVTPSFNQASFLEETIRSVLLQGYPHLEYIVVDGGSTDGSVEILEKYGPWLDWWVSEEDRGQSDALNKGFRRATGEVFAYLNSDDVYVPGALFRVAGDVRRAGTASWQSYGVEDFWPDGRTALQKAPWLHSGLDRYRADPIAGIALFENGELKTTALLAWLLDCVRVHQPGSFWLANQHWEIGGFEPDLHFGFDLQFFWGLVARGYLPVFHGGAPISRFRWHPTSKSNNAEEADGENRFASELRGAALDFLPFLAPGERAIVRRYFLDYWLSLVWSRYRREKDRSAALHGLWEVLARMPSALGNRFFIGSAARFILGSPG